MKQLVKLLVVAVVMAVSSTVAFAQQQSGEQRMSRERLAEVEARNIARQLAFNEDVTARFVATYCECQKEVWALGPRKAARKGASENANEERIKQRFAMSEKLLGIRQKYYKKYSKFLTQAQIERVYELERQMMRRHANRAQTRQNGKQRR